MGGTVGSPHDLCREEDSNLRRLSQRVYSPPPLATRESLRGRAIVAACPSTPYDRDVEHFDVLVVGAGPAGSTAALCLARSGAKVLLVDKALFPRDKPCGGGLTGRALRHLPCDVTPVVERVVDRMVLRAGYRTTVDRTSREPLDRHDPTPATRSPPRRAGCGRGRRLPTRRTGLGHRARRLGCVCADRRDARPGLVPRRGRRRQRRRRARGRARRRDRSRRRAGGERAMGRARSRRLRARRLGGARRRSRRLRLGVSEGRPCEPRRRRVDGGGATAARPSRPAGTCTRDRPGAAQRRSRAPASDACARRRRRHGGAHCSSATPPVSWIRSRATACTRRSSRHDWRRRRSTRVVPRRTRRHSRRRSTVTRRRRGRRSAPRIAIPARACGLCVPPVSSGRSQVFCVATWPTRATLRGSRSRRFACLRGSRAGSDATRRSKATSGSCRCSAVHGSQRRASACRRGRRQRRPPEGRAAARPADRRRPRTGVRLRRRSTMPSSRSFSSRSRSPCRGVERHSTRAATSTSRTPRRGFRAFA